MIKSNKLNIFKNFSIFLCLVPMLVLSIFCLVPNTDDYSVCAVDTTITDYTFTGANLVVQGALMNNSLTNFNSNCFVNVRFAFSYINGSYKANVYGTYLSTNRTDLKNFGSGFDISTDGVTRVVGSVVDQYTVVFFSCVRSGAITGAINRVVLSHNSTTHYNTITYYDVNNSYISFGVFTYSENSVVETFKFDTRTYYINLSFENNTYYEIGYNDGYESGFADGSSSGYESGYNSGSSVGYADGYNDGLNDSNSYSFNSLFGAVLDVPVNAFKSLFNFEILGVNVFGLLTGILSVGIIVMIIKLCTGGK